MHILKVVSESEMIREKVDNGKYCICLQRVFVCDTLRQFKYFITTTKSTVWVILYELGGFVTMRAFLEWVYLLIICNYVKNLYFDHQIDNNTFVFRVAFMFLCKNFFNMNTFTSIRLKSRKVGRYYRRNTHDFDIAARESCYKSILRPLCPSLW